MGEKKTIQSRVSFIYYHFFFLLFFFFHGRAAGNSHGRSVDDDDDTVVGDALLVRAGNRFARAEKSPARRRDRRARRSSRVVDQLFAAQRSPRGTRAHVKPPVWRRRTVVHAGRRKPRIRLPPVRVCRPRARPFARNRLCFPGNVRERIAISRQTRAKGVR